VLQDLARQLENERLAVTELERTVSIEIRSVQVAAQKNFEEQQDALSQAWHMVHAERAQVQKESAELHRVGREYELRENAEKDRLQRLLEREKTALASEWEKLKEQQSENRQQQLMLENQLAALETSQQKLDALETQRNLYVDFCIFVEERAV